jgi:hypothetical protein
VNLSPARLAIIVALVVGGVAVLMNGFEGSSGAAAAGASPTPTIVISPSPTTASPTESPAETPAPETDGVTFMVFNGTSTTGLGAIVQQDLEDEGYVAPTEAANALTSTVPKTTVYFRGGADAAQNESNATYMADQFLDGAAVKLLGDDYEAEVSKNIQLVVVVGLDNPGATT